MVAYSWPGGSRNVRLLSMVAIAPLVYVTLSRYVSFAHVASLAVWVIGISTDLSSTRGFMMKGFIDEERKLLFALLVKRFDFFMASLLFIVLVENPVALLISVIFYMNFFNLKPLEAMLGSGFILGLAHVEASLSNLTSMKHKPVGY